MASLKNVRLGPVALTATYTTNIFNAPTLTGGVNPPSGSNTFLVIKKIRITNKTGAARTVRLYIDSTSGNTAGKEVCYDKSVPANDWIELYGPIRLDVADFLVGGADQATSLTIEADADIGVA